MLKINEMKANRGIIIIIIIIIININEETWIYKLINCNNCNLFDYYIIYIYIVLLIITIIALRFSNCEKVYTHTHA